MQAADICLPERDTAFCSFSVAAYRVVSKRLRISCLWLAIGGMTVSAKIRIKCHIFMYVTGKLEGKALKN